MIFVRNKGQMCNNIFQYIQLYAWGREHGRTTMSMRFAYKYPYFAISQAPRETVFHYLLGKYLAFFHLIPTIDFDRCQSREEGVEQISRSRHCMVQGWGHIRYPELVSKYLPDIRSLFAFAPAIIHKVQQRMGAPSTIRIGVHIRRGDYKTFMGGKFYFSDDEYIAHINRILSLLPAGQKPCVYICTNDSELNQKNFSGKVKADVIFSEGTGEEDLCLLSACDYVVGPASSYSLIACLYGKAKLYWMNRGQNVAQLSLTQFGDFETMSRQLDIAFMK